MWDELVFKSFNRIVYNMIELYIIESYIYIIE